MWNFEGEDEGSPNEKMGHRRMCESDGSSGMFPQHLLSFTQSGLEGVIVDLRKVQQKISVCWMNTGEHRRQTRDTIRAS